MIKIIKPAPERYSTVCCNCGCEFEYDLRDLCDLYLTKYVRCPSCGSDCYHAVNTLRNASGHTMEELKLFLKDELADCQEKFKNVNGRIAMNDMSMDYNYGFLRGILNALEVIAMEFGMEDIL